MSGHAIPTKATRRRRVARRASFAALIGGSVVSLGMLVLPSTGTAAGNTSGSVSAPECGTQHGLSDPTNSNNKVLSSYWFAVTDHGTTTAVCSLMGNVKGGDVVTAHFVPADTANASASATPATTAAEITLVSNNAPASNPRMQTLFDCASFGDTSGAGDPCATSTTTDLTVTVPGCGFQVDLIYGETITPLVQGTYLKQHRFINGGEGKATCSIATTPVPTTTTVGQPIKDTATVTPSTITGTVTFDLFPPTDDICDGNPIFSSTGTLSGGHATSGTFTPTGAGTYHWTASMSSPALSSACADEPVVITTASTPAITTSQSAGGTVGTAVSDTATVTGVTAPSGNVVFRLFGASDASCSAAAVFTDTESISSAGTAHTTQSIKPATAGTYHWTATYTGVTPNLVSGCASEPVTITATCTAQCGGGGVQGITTSTPSTGAGLPLPLGAGLIAAGVFALLGEPRLRRRLG